MRQAGRLGRSKAAIRLARFLRESRDSLEERPSTEALKLVHPFPAPMSFRLADKIIRAATDDKGVVLDPMAGSGTVLAVSRRFGRQCYAFDLDPLAGLTIRVLASKHDLTEIRKAGEQVLHEVSRCRDIRRVDSALLRYFDEETYGFVRFWFPANARRELFLLWRAISRVESAAVRRVLSLAFSKTIIAKTAGVSRAIDLAHTRPHRRAGKKVPKTLALFRRRIAELLRLLEPLGGAEPQRPLFVKRADARRLPLPGDCVDLVLSSSPYANAIDYMRAHKFSLVWMGYSLSQLRAIRAGMIGAELSEPNVCQELGWLEAYLPGIDGVGIRRRNIIRRYFYDMNRVLSELARVTKPGGACVLVLGRSRVRNAVVDTPMVVARLAEGHGMSHIGTKYRRLNPLRRSLPFPVRRSPGNPLSNRIAEEAIVALVKR